MTSELRWIVVWEAAIFFSIPCWELTVNFAWPSKDPWQFTLLVLLGALSALVCCHVIPALCGPSVQILQKHRAGRVLLVLLAAWLSIGAAATLFGMASITGSMFVLWRDVADKYRIWQWTARMIAVVLVAVSVICVTKPFVRHRLLLWSVTVGIALSVTACVLQSGGLNLTNSYMQSASGLGDRPARLVAGMILSSAPAAILALRIGRMGLSWQTVVQSGFLGVFLPLIAAVSLVSTAKVFGARLYWRPSLPIDWTWAFMWLSGDLVPSVSFAWPLGLTLVPILLVLAEWVRETNLHCGSQGWRFTAFSAVLAAGYLLQPAGFWDGISRTWLISIPVVCIFLGLTRLVVRSGSVAQRRI